MTALVGFVSCTYYADEANVTVTPGSAADTYLAALPRPGAGALAINSEWALSYGGGVYRCGLRAAQKAEGTYTIPPATGPLDAKQPTGLSRGY